MLDPKAFANAAAILALTIYLVCVALVATVPDLAFSLFTLTFHGLNTEILRPEAMASNPVNIVLGALLWPIFIWVIFYSLAYLYNYFKK